jgi:hypothetical protein
VVTVERVVDMDVVDVGGGGRLPPLAEESWNKAIISG